MTKAVRHFIFCGLLVCICFALTVCAAALRSGDIIGNILSTNIRAFINGYEIPSYNIDDRLGVVAEDLANYGFDVVWDPETSTLNLSRNEHQKITPIAVPKKEEVISGIAVAPVLYTEIVTYLDGKEVRSFNIDGRTVIYFNELSAYGSYLYDHSISASMISYDRHGYEKNTVQSRPAEIVHAGGAIGGMAGSNSLEAMNLSYEKGARFIEVDFVLSSDGIPVCLHNWSNYYSNFLTEEPITAEEFSNIRIFEKYTSMTFDSLADWMKLHPDVYIVTDVKEENVRVLLYIANNYPELVARIIPQIYQYDEYTPVRAMGYSNIILTLYRLPTYNEKADAKYNAEFAKKNSLFAVTADFTLANEDFVGEFTAAGIPLYLHTVNDPAEKQRFFDMGVSGVYTDNYQ